MNNRHPGNVPAPLPLGTQVVIQKETIHPNGRTLHPRGAVASVVRTTKAADWEYRLRFPDGIEETLQQGEFDVLSHFKTRQGTFNETELATGDLYDRVVYRCVIGSQAYGLADQQSD